VTDQCDEASIYGIILEADSIITSDYEPTEGDYAFVIETDVAAFGHSSTNKVMSIIKLNSNLETHWSMAFNFFTVGTMTPHPLLKFRNLS